MAKTAKPSPTPQSCRQHISCPTSVTNIDVAFIVKCLAGSFDLVKETHLKHSPFKCDVCNCFFKRKICLIQHKGSKKHLAKMKCLADQEHLDKPSEPVEMSDVATKDINGNDFECDQCSFSTKTKWNLIQHQARYLYTS